MRRIRNCLAHEIGEEKAGIGLPAAAQGRVGPAKGKQHIFREFE